MANDVTLSFRSKDWFFDRKRVADLVGGKSNAYRLGRAGAFVRTRARTSIRRRKAVSAPGGPPSAHSKDSVATIKNIQFAYDPRRTSVVVGPVALNHLYYLGATLRGGAVPNVLEHGGTLGVIEWQRPGGLWERADLRSVRRRGWPVRVRQASYRARPYMGPALAAEAPKFASFWNGPARAAG